MAIRNLSQKGIDFIKSFEGIRDGDTSTPKLDPYLDLVGVWTIGYGHAISDGGKFLRGTPGKIRAKELYPDGITLQQAEDLLNGQLVNYCRDVQAAVRVELNDDQFSALVSFAYNVGVGSLKNSSLLRKLNEGDYIGAAREFVKWDKGTILGKKVSIPGLTRRRKSEAAMFMGKK